MAFSTKGRYGTMAMLDLAIHYGEGPILAKDIAKRQHISQRYLEHLLISLKLAGMVRSTRGTHGGFSLAKPPSQIRLDEIIRVTEGSMAPAECVDNPEAYPRVAICAVYDVWSELKTAINSVLESINLQDLLERQRQKWDSNQSDERTANNREVQTCEKK